MVFDGPTIPFRVHVEIAKLDQVRMVLVYKLTEGVKFIGIICKSGENKVIQ